MMWEVENKAKHTEPMRHLSTPMHSNACLRKRSPKASIGSLGKPELGKGRVGLCQRHLGKGK